LAPRNDGGTSGQCPFNTFFTIFVDWMFTTFMGRAFTKARDVTSAESAIA
jgi:hypothetical protein